MREESSRTHDVFLSYSSKDKNWADAACAVLERHGVRCWIAPRDITPGEEWGAAIIRGLNGSRIMVLIFSGHANDSGQVRREVERAMSQGMTVLPVRIEDVRPEGAMEYALGNTHWLDAFTPPVQRQLGLLARSVKTLLGHAVESAAAAAPAGSAEDSWVAGEEPAGAKAIPHTEPADPRRPRASWPIAVAASVIGLVALGVIMITFKSRNGETRSAVHDNASTTAGRDDGVVSTPVRASVDNSPRPPAETSPETRPAVAKRRGGSPKRPADEPSRMPAADSLQPGSVWVAEPGNWTFTVLEREGERFKARFVVGKQIREVNGTIKEGRVRWLAGNVKVISGDPGHDNEGQINGNEISMTYSSPNRPGSGQFKLRLRKPGPRTSAGG